MTFGNRRALAGARLLLLSAAVAAAAPGCRRSVAEDLEQARTLQDLGQTDDAIALLRDVVSREPDNADASYALGTALMQAKQGTLAVVYFTQAERDEHRAAEAALMLAKIYLDGENFEGAREAATRVLARDPHNLAALRIRATAAAQLGHFDVLLADSDLVLRESPGDPQGLLARSTALMKLGRLPEAEQAYQEQRRLADESHDPAASAKACVAYANFFDEGRHDTARAEREYDACVQAFPIDAAVAHLAMRFYDTHELRPKSLGLLRRAAEELPQNLPVHQELAVRLARQGNAAEADKVLADLAELLGDAQGWATLADYRQQQGDRAGATTAVQKAIDLSPDDSDPLRLMLVDLEVGAGDLAAAEKSIATIATPMYQSIGRGRLLLAQGDAKGALGAFDQGLREWPGNAGVRYLAGTAALQLGDKDRALREFREATRADAGGTDAALIAAKLHFERGEFEDAADLVARHTAHRSSGPRDAALVLSGAQQALGSRVQAERTLEEYVKRAPKDPVGVAALASLVRADEGPAAAAKLVASSALDLTDPASERALRVLAQALIDQKRTADALARVDAALARYPDSAALHEIRGRVLIAQGEAQPARRELERALSLQADYAPAEAALGGLVGTGGDLAHGVERLDRAAQLDPDTPEYAYQAAQFVLAQGKTDDGLARLRAIVALHPTYTQACNDLAWLLASRKQDLDQALALAQRSVRISPRAELLDTLGYVQLQRGEAAAAAETLRKALAADPKAAGTRYRLGVALAAQGQGDEAQRAFREALGSGPFPEADDARARLAELEHS